MQTLRILRRPEVESITGLGRSRINVLEREGRFPKRLRLSDRAVGWRSDEIQLWIESRPRGEDALADSGQDINVRVRGQAA